MFTVLVSGGGGQLAHFIKNCASPAWNLINAEKSKLDITSYLQVNKIVETYRPDIIINCAAFSKVDEAERHVSLAYAVNENGLENLVAAARKYNAKVIHISTDYVFNGDKGEPYVESDMPFPLNVYGKSKLAGELQVDLEKDIIIRTSWLFSEREGSFYTKIQAFLKSAPVTHVVEDQISGPTYAGDLALAIINIVEDFLSKERWMAGLYHFAGFPFVSRYEFACYMQDQSSLYRSHLVPVSSDFYLNCTKRPRNSSLNSSLISEIYNISPSDWRSAVSTLVHHERN